MYIVGTNGFMCGLIILNMNSIFSAWIIIVGYIKRERMREREREREREVANEFCFWLTREN